MEAALAVAGFLLTAGGAISAYTVQAVRAATGAVVESIKGLSKSVDLLRADLISVRETQIEHGKAIAVNATRIDMIEERGDRE